MDFKKIKVGSTYPYTSRKNQGRGKVEEVYEKETGAWITLHDKARGVRVTVRPSQVGK